MPISQHKATVGRKLWVWVPPKIDGVLDTQQGFDATVLYVKTDGSVFVRATTHTGADLYLEVEVHDPSEEDMHHIGWDHDAKPFATWMPYQKQQMDAAKS